MFFGFYHKHMNAKRVFNILIDIYIYILVVCPRYARNDYLLV